MESRPAGYSSSEDEIDDFGYEKPKKIYQNQPRILTPNEKLCDAACDNDVDAAKEALEKGADIHHRSNYHNNHSVIMVAASYGSFEVMDILIKHGANVNDKHEMFDVIMCLCNSNFPDESVLLKCLNLVLENGGNPLELDWMGSTSLMHAARRNKLLLAARLIESGCSVNAVDGEKWTPLFYSVESGSVAMTKFLIESGGDIKARNRFGIALWDHAASKDNKELLDLVTPPELLEEEVEAVQAYTPHVSQFKQVLLRCPKLNDRMYGYHAEAVDFMRAIGLESVATIIEKKNIQFAELITWNEHDWIAADVKLSYPLKKINLFVRKYHEKEWGKGSVPKVDKIVSKENEVVELFKVTQILLTCLSSSHINSATSLYVLNNYEGPMTNEIKEKLEKIKKSTIIIKNQVSKMKRKIKEIDSQTVHIPDKIKPLRTGRNKFINWVIVNCFYLIVRTVVCEWRT